MCSLTGAASQEATANRKTVFSCFHLNGWFKRPSPCRFLHLLHHPWRSAGEQAGADRLCSQRAGGLHPLGDQLRRGGLQGQAGGAGESLIFQKNHLVLGKVSTRY